MFVIKRRKEKTEKKGKQAKKCGRERMKRDMLTA